MGDSKSISANSWGTTLLAELNAAGASINFNWSEITPRNWAVNGTTVAALKSSINTYLASHTIDPRASQYVFLINFGSNDAPLAPLEATWKSDYAYIIDAILVKYPAAKIYITKPWGTSYAAWWTTFSTWIDDIVALYPGQVFVGDDERTWLEGGDNGATNTIDGVHYSAAGQTAKVAAIRAALGY
jgi:lysophospholipase L1-like esterase